MKIHDKSDRFYKDLNHAAGMRNLQFDGKGESDFRSLGRTDVRSALAEICKFVEAWTDNGHDIEDWNGCYLWKGVTSFSFAPGVPIYLKIEWKDSLQTFVICSCHKKGA